MPVFSAKPLQFNKKWLEHSKQFLIVYNRQNEMRAV